MEPEVVDLRDPIWQQYFQIKPGLINFAVLKLARMWTPSRTTNPALNQELELEYIQKRSPWFDLRLFAQSLRAFIASKGNVKARGKPEPEIENRLNIR
jgi:lipopolysaccharide/colanic/teichoic acid biosynthesis glycosyltransferase